MTCTLSKGALRFTSERLRLIGIADVAVQGDYIVQRSVTMKVLLLSAIAMISLTAWVLTHASEAPRSSDVRVPILVELFTSEGCSSCPPADALLSRLDRQPVAGAELVVLSEHVDYWNHLGWKDPYSSHFFSDRQSAYAERFGSLSVYTPQVVVDGANEFVGSNSGSANGAFVQALRAPKIPVHLSSVTLERTKTVRAHVETGPLPDSYDLSEVEVYAVVALNHAESRVSNGENGGRTLTHTAVVRNFTKVGTLRKGESFTQDVLLKVDAGADVNNLRLIALLQEPRQGRVVGATVELVGAK